MRKSKRIAAAVAAFAAAVTMSGCAAPRINTDDDEEIGVVLPEPPSDADIETVIPEIPSVQPEETPPEEEPEAPETPEPEPEPPEIEVPKVKSISYIAVTGSGVNIRSGSGTNYASYGTAEQSTLYALDGETDGWYQTGYQNKTAYISSKYSQPVEMQSSGNERIEAVIAEGTKLLGSVYVFGAVRYHDGNGNLLRGFTVAEFDCSSLMQYIFYKGANVNLQLTTRTQIAQGKTVTKSQLQRGDLMFFTNESRKNNTGIERVGHVALYLGDNWILHTASDYAKIEQISAKRWSYFIQGQRLL